MNHDFNLGLMLGRIASGQDTLISDVRQIRTRLEDGDEWMQASDKRMDRIETDIHELRNRKSPPSSPSLVERLAKQAGTYLIPGGVLWATGSVDAAIKVLQAIAGAAK